MPLKEIFDKGDLGFVVDLFRYYTRLLVRWATIFGNNFLVGSVPSPLYTHLTLKPSNPQSHVRHKSSQHGTPPGTPRSSNPRRPTLRAGSTSSTPTLFLYGTDTKTFNNNIQIQQLVFDFYDILISYPTKHQIVHITMPSSSVVYFPFFSGSASSVSRICGILTQFYPPGPVQC